jgi:predicted secreted protein
MSVDVATFGKGTILKLGDGDTPEVFTQINGITKWGVDPGGAGDPEKIDITSGSTVGMVREKMDGYSERRPGVIDFDLLCDLSNTQHAALEAAAIAGTDLNFQLVVPTKTGTNGYDFTARASGFPLDIPHDKVVTVKAKLAIKEGTWVPQQ